ncbi:MAG TPA: protein translocase subunit SecF [Candidatus Dormibacteraeota bacterium]
MDRPTGAVTEETADTTVVRRVRRFDLVGRRNWFFAASLLIILPGILSMVTRGFLLGIDFAGGTEFDLQFGKSVTQQQVADAVTASGVVGTVQAGANGTFIVRTGFADPQHQKAFEDTLAGKLGTSVDSLSTTTVGGTVAGETIRNAFIAILAASVLILGYLTFRFRRVQGGWRSGVQFGGSALLALLHDVAVLGGIFSILGKVLGLRIGEIDTLFMTAVLTVVGFSVHDTIVVFDRIRENMIVARSLTFEQVANLSIMQTAARSIITSFTVVLVLVALLVAGGDSLKGFVLALLIGIVSGTYSSVFNATPILVVWRRLAGVTR